MAAYIEDTTLLIVTENGFGKRTDLPEYRVQKRAGKGILTYKVTEKTGLLAGMKLVNDSDDIILISSDGTIIRMPASTISNIGRNTQGVTVMRTGPGNRVVGLARIVKDDIAAEDGADEAGDDAVDDVGDEVGGESGDESGVDVIDIASDVVDADGIGNYYGTDDTNNSDDIDN
jgi:DNA gyrase subunit A